MSEKLLKYYRERVTTNALVFKHMKFSYFISGALMTIVFSCILMLITMSAFSSFLKFDFLLLIVAFSSSAILMSIQLHYFNKKAKTILLKRFGISSRRYSWRTPEFNSMQDQLLIDFLILHGLFNENKIKLLSEALTKEFERKKLPKLLAPGILLTLFIPSYNQFLMYIFKTVTDTTQATILLVNVLGLVAFLILLINATKWISMELFDTFSLRENIIRKNLIEHLEQIIIEAPSNENSKK